MLRSLSKSNVFDVPFHGATFTCRALSGREFRKLESIKGSEGGDSASRLFDSLKKGVRGWKDVLVDDPEAIKDLEAAGVELKQTSSGALEVPFDLDHLDLILDLADAGELLGLMAKGNTPSGEVAGKSDSPAPSAQA